MAARALLHATTLGANALVVLAVAVAIAAAAAAAGTAVAQAYPAKPIRLIIPFPPGGGSDVTGRIVAMAMSERLGMQMVVDNRAGAGGIIGTELAANAARDG